MTVQAPPAAAQMISVVLPVYNEAENIGPCLRQLAAALKGEAYEILVCYDFEGDTTLAAIEAMEDRPEGVRLVRNDLGRGVAFALKAGFAAARGDVVVTSMADLSDPPEAIVRMAEKIRGEGADVVSGSRYMSGGSQTGGPRLKTLMSRAAGVSLWWIAGVGTHDSTTNFRGYSAAFLRKMTVESEMGFEVALELTVKAHLGGYKVNEVPSSWRDRTAGQSNFRLWKWLPRYLYWFFRAMAAPMAVWGAWAAVALAGAGWIVARDRSSPLAWAVCGGLAALCFALILTARRLRGRMSFFDLVIPLGMLALLYALVRAWAVST